MELIINDFDVEVTVIQLVSYLKATSQYEKNIYIESS